MESGNVILKNASVLLEGKAFARKDILICDGIVSRVSDNLNITGGTIVYDCSSFFVVPGLVDLHVHLRQPGQEEKETIATGTAAAAAAGYTTVCAMPNLSPVPDCPESLEVELEAIRKDARVRVLPYASITKGRRGRGEVVDMAALKPFVAGFSDDGCGVQEEAVMEEAMRLAASLDVRIVAHCEVESMLHGGYIHDGSYCRTHGHRGISSESEWAEVERDCDLAARTGAAFHVCHVSTKESVGIIRRAKAAGVRVTAETCPHYLLLTDGDLREDGRFKMNPPLREAADRDALIAGLEDGTIDCIVTDHAPHTAAQKARGLEGSAMGIVGLETAFPLLYTHFVRSGRWSLEFLVDKMSIAPRRIFGLGQSLAEGLPADVAVLDLDAKYRIDPSEFLSKGRSTPFEGWEVYGRNVLTLVGGKAVFESERIRPFRKVF